MLVSDKFDRCHDRIKDTDVLILVLVDVGLGPVVLHLWNYGEGLNPCFSGCWSRTHFECVTQSAESSAVLILVLVDVGLGRSYQIH